MTNDLAPKDDVLAALEVAFAGIAPPPPEGFCEWYLRIMAECDAVAERIQQQAEVMLREVETRKKSIQYFKGQEFRQRILAMLEANGGTKKSINLLTGKAGLRKLSARLRVTDENMAMAFAEKYCPEAVKVKKSILVKPLIEHLKSTGELPDGCELTNDVEIFYPWIDGTPRLTEGDSDDNNL